MIIFRGKSLDSVAPVKIEDIRVSPIQLNPIVRARAAGYGETFVEMRGGVRTVAVTFAVLEDNKNLRQDYLRHISEWATSDTEDKLEIPYHDGMYLMGICTAKPEPSIRQWWESKLRLTFTCFNNPFWNSVEEKSVACGTAFFVNGDAPPLMEIRRTLSSAASNQTYSNGSESMTFSSIPAGDMVIDLNRQTAKVGNSSIMGNYQYTSRFLRPRTGSQTISGTGTVYYRERWM